MKIQEFSQGFKALCNYYPKENVWHSDFCEPYEWNSLEEMRRDMLIHYFAETEEDKKRFESWHCSDENEFMERLDKYLENINL